MKIRTDGFRDHELTTSSEEKIATPLYIYAVVIQQKKKDWQQRQYY